MGRFKVERLGSPCNGIRFFGRDCKQSGARGEELEILNSRHRRGGQDGKVRMNLKRGRDFQSGNESGLLQKGPLQDAGDPGVTAARIPDCPEAGIGAGESQWGGEGEHWDFQSRGHRPCRRDASPQAVVGARAKTDAQRVRKAVRCDRSLECFEEGGGVGAFVSLVAQKVDRRFHNACGDKGYRDDR